MNIGERIRYLRIQNKLNIEQLAEKIGVSKNTVSNWELDRCEPGVFNLCCLADYFNTSVDYLLGREVTK